MRCVSRRKTTRTACTDCPPQLLQMGAAPGWGTALTAVVQDGYVCPRDLPAGCLTGLDSLEHLLEENRMNASDLARLLGVHPSLGSKILKGQRSLTVDHIRKLAERFKVSPGLFLD